MDLPLPVPPMMPSGLPGRNGEGRCRRGIAAPAPWIGQGCHVNRNLTRCRSASRRRTVPGAAYHGGMRYPAPPCTPAARRPAALVMLIIRLASLIMLHQNLVHIVDKGDDLALGHDGRRPPAQPPTQMTAATAARLMMALGHVGSSARRCVPTRSLEVLVRALFSCCKAFLLRLLPGKRPG